MASAKISVKVTVAAPKAVRNTPSRPLASEPAFPPADLRRGRTASQHGGENWIGCHELLFDLVEPSLFVTTGHQMLQWPRVFPNDRSSRLVSGQTDRRRLPRRRRGPPPWVIVPVHRSGL